MSEINDPSEISPAKKADRANQQASWDVLLSRVSRGEESAMAEMYDSTSQIVYSLALRMLGNEADAEEVTIDVYSQVWRTAGRYSRDRGTVFAWILNIVRTRAIDRLRARAIRARTNERMEQPEVVPDTALDPESLTLTDQRRRRVRAALAVLPAEQRHCIELAFFGGLTHAELAQQLGEPLGTVKTRIRAGMMRLRTTLGDYA